MVDPGDMRPENCLISANRVVLIDFEIAAVRRRSIALDSLVRDNPPAQDLLAPYVDRARAVSRFRVASAVHSGSQPARAG